MSSYHTFVLVFPRWVLRISHAITRNLPSCPLLRLSLHVDWLRHHIASSQPQHGFLCLSQICSLYPHFTRQGKGKTRGKWGRAQWRALSALRQLSSSSAYVRKGRCHHPSGGRWRFNQSAHEDSSAGYVVVCCSCRQFLVPSSLSVRYLLFMLLLSVAQPAQSGQ